MNLTYEKLQEAIDLVEVQGRVPHHIHMPVAWYRDLQGEYKREGVTHMEFYGLRVYSDAGLVDHAEVIYEPGACGRCKVRRTGGSYGERQGRD